MCCRCLYRACTRISIHTINPIQSVRFWYFFVVFVLFRLCLISHVLRAHKHGHTQLSPLNGKQAAFHCESVTQKEPLQWLITKGMTSWGIPPKPIVFMWNYTWTDCVPVNTNDKSALLSRYSVDMLQCAHEPFQQSLIDEQEYQITQYSNKPSIPNARYSSGGYGQWIECQLKL